MFFKNSHKKYIKEFEDDVKKEILDLKLDMAKLTTQIISLRGLVNRKLDYPNKSEPEETIKNPDGLDMLRKANARSN